MGVFKDIVRFLFEVCNGNLEMVVEMYLDLCEVLELMVNFLIVGLSCIVGLNFISNNFY